MKTINCKPRHAASTGAIAGYGAELGKAAHARRAAFGPEE